ncbi:MAG TPA: alkaline phosphatase [Acidimicrobiaceae bacterium]|nr:alkaline phosphatase [Acidimicrobiaceae bacterium]
MAPLSRRTFLAASAAVPALVVAGCSDSGSDSGDTVPTTDAAPTSAGPGDSTSSTVAQPTTTAPPDTLPAVDLPSDPFTLGVASGDPDDSSVVLWTRLAPDPLNGGGMPDDDIAVRWEASADEAFASLTASGDEVAAAATGHTVHALAQLPPGTWFYRFRVGEWVSPVGRTRVAPAPGTPGGELRIATGSCQNYSHGYYAAHRGIAEQQPDLVLWLGDYIYEGAAADGALPSERAHLGPEPTTVVEYRNRYARYKTDPQLQAAHAACPWFVVWDDHEVENNYAGITPQDAAEAPAFAARRAAAYQAWWEHQPTRLAPPTADGLRIYRSAAWGDLLTVAMLDGRQYRTDQACGDVRLNLEPPCSEVTAPGRTMLGDEQESWLFDTLDTATTTWKVLGNQVIMADATLNGAILNFDMWDGYPEQRDRILQHLADTGSTNVVVVTGDIHFAAVAQLRAGERGTGTPVAVEFIATSISSDGNVGPELTDVLKSFPDLLDANLVHRGYVLHTVTPEQWTAEYRIVEQIDDPESPVNTWAKFAIDQGTNTVRQLA